VKGTGPENLQIILGANGGSISGTTETADRKAVSARVFLVPDPSRRRNSMFYREAQSDASGTYQFKGLAPGDYKVFAFEVAPPPGAIENVEFVTPYEQRGVRVVVREAQTSTATGLPVIQNR
jgi:hypothetical protein